MTEELAEALAREADARAAADGLTRGNAYAYMYII